MNIGKVQFKDWLCDAHLIEYMTNGRQAINLTCTATGDPIAVATTNLTDVDVPDGNILIKCSGVHEDMHASLIQAGIVGPEIRRHGAGMVLEYAIECELLKRGMK